MNTDLYLSVFICVHLWLRLLRLSGGILLLPPQEPQEKWPSENSGDGAHRKLGLAENSPGHGVRQYQKRGAQDQGAGKHDSQILAKKQPNHVRHNQSHEADCAADRYRDRDKQR